MQAVTGTGRREARPAAREVERLAERHHRRLALGGHLSSHPEGPPSARSRGVRNAGLRTRPDPPAVETSSRPLQAGLSEVALFSPGALPPAGRLVWRSRVGSTGPRTRCVPAPSAGDDGAVRGRARQPRDAVRCDRRWGDCSTHPQARWGDTLLRVGRSVLEGAYKLSEVKPVQ